ncbi:unnamed protein product [Phytophthora fragariaefolia]|uniref:Unnamed protein product n=1 Tax=Phytophthora fragariaefolia TaxID=1490495 RepID=A0A9W6Y328_9STRA|nr:unnamed protein product [Phytophthora fragariaefolia]
MRYHFLAPLSLLGSLAVGSTSIDAAECTDAQAAYADSVWATAANTSSCSPYVTQTEPVYVNAPCTATKCVVVVEGVAKDLPDCTFSGINNKIEVENALTACNGGDTEDAGSPIFSSDASAATTSTSSSQANADTLSPPTESSSALTPGSAASSPSCTTTEVADMWELYVSIAQSHNCTGDAVINGYSVNVLTKCDSDCAGEIKALTESLPDCYYDYEHMNKKQDVQEQLKACDTASGYVSITLYPDSTIVLASSSGSTIASWNNSSGAGLSHSSGDKPSDNTMDSSSVGARSSSSSAPRVQEFKLHLWAISTLFAGILADFSS